MSRFEACSELSIKTFQYFTSSYRDIIKERDKDFYKYNTTDLDNFSFVINKYSGKDYTLLNNYLRDGVVDYNSKYDENDLKSWAWCLHSSLQYRTSNVENGTEVYRGISHRAPYDWEEGDRFYFGEFVSTSKLKEKAEAFAINNTLLVIKITNNGNNGNNNYCRDISKISKYPEEEEILITSFCRYEITDIDRDDNLDIFYLDCLGY